MVFPLQEDQPIGQPVAHEQQRMRKKYLVVYELLSIHVPFAGLEAIPLAILTLTNPVSLRSVVLPATLYLSTCQRACHARPGRSHGS